MQLLFNPPSLGDVADHAGQQMIVKGTTADRQFGDELLMPAATEQDFLLEFATGFRARQTEPVLFRHQPL